MAQVTLSAIGSAIAGPIGGAIGAFVGGQIDQAVIDSLTPPRQVGPRIPGLRLQSTAEGAPVACVFGRVRIAGQVIWAARFKERRIEQRTGGGKGGGPRTEEYRYSLSFAVGLCEGPIDGVGRVWADGKALDMTGVTMRVHLGGEDQAPDALIEAVEGDAPAYRGLAYVVFEDLPLAAFGNRPPQLSFEIFRRPRVEGETALEDALKGVCLIPGAGEFMLATEVVQRRDGITRITAENVNNTDGRADLVVSLDHLQAQLPNLEEVTLVVSWFGTDLRCGSCQIKPGVEQAAKATIPFLWSAGSVGREDAHLVSTHDGGPAYGGTPADEAVRQAIAELKARGLKVGLYPFILMDVPEDNGLPDPYGEAEQGAYPWRGRITCEEGDDQTSAATTQIATFFGAAGPGHFSISGGQVAYSGPAEWSLRRMVLHYAKLAAQAGGVDTFLIASEMRGLTTLRDASDAFPAVAELQDLAGDCRTILGSETAIGYAADWSEYFGHQPDDASGDVFFHLDPLWADDEIDFVGIDYYPPLADWRDGDDHLDAVEGFAGPHQAAYITANIEGGEGFDWYYASDADRLSQTRTPIADGAYDEPWVFRPKDLKSWWENAHHDRPGGVRSVTPTAWVPESKPIRLTEFGCPAVDRGANSPNLFVDPKSSESSLPPFSAGTRDDLGQRVALEAVLAHFDADPMVEAMSAWCWDARPFPDFPGRGTVWADAPNWALGHWLTGRTGVAPLGGLATALALRADVALDLGDAGGVLTGYVIERPMRLREALAPLAEAFAFSAGERGGGAVLIARDGPLAASLTEDDLALPDDRNSTGAARSLEAPPDLVRLRFIDETADYQTGALTVRRDPAAGGDAALIDLPMVMAAPQAEQVARRILARAQSARDEATAYLSPLMALKLEPGDLVEVPGLDGVWRVVRVDRDERPRAFLEAAGEPEAPVPSLPDWTPAPPAEPAGPPVLLMLDLPPLGGFEDDTRPIAAVSCEPWRAMNIHAGVSVAALTVRARAAAPAALGETTADLPAGPLHRLHYGTALIVRLEGGTVQSRPLDAVLAGANALAVQGSSGEWEVIQFLNAEAVDTDVWSLTGLLRGQAGSEPAMGDPTLAGAPVVLLDENLTRAGVALSERGLPLVWRAAPAGGPAAGQAMAEASFTWQGLALRPWSPAHLRIAPDGADLAIAWTRRARIGGDGWDASEPPLSEETEAYRIEVLDGADVVRTTETAAPAFTYTAAMQAADFPSGTPNPLRVRVAQGSATFGWGAPCARLLLY